MELSILNKLKDVSGIGLGAQEQYNRAYEKGVFLQPPDYPAASKHFLTASEKFEKEGNAQMAKKAKANSLLYELASTRSMELLQGISECLSGMSEIERIGSQKELLPVEPLIIELQALREESQADHIQAYAEKAAHFKSASETLMKMGTSPLFFAELLQLRGPVDKAMTRAFYYQAKSDFYLAYTKVFSSPEMAHDHFQKAAVEFRQAQEAEWAGKSDILVDQISAKRHCWICDREMTGKDFFYAYYPADVLPYHNQLIESLKQDAGMLDQQEAVTLCTVCGSAIEKQSDRYALKRTNELREWLQPILNSYQNAISSLQDRVSHLERLSHKH